MSHPNGEDWRTPMIVPTGKETADEQLDQQLLSVKYYCWYKEKPLCHHRGIGIEVLLCINSVTWRKMCAHAKWWDNGDNTHISTPFTPTTHSWPEVWCLIGTTTTYPIPRPVLRCWFHGYPIQWDSPTHKGRHHHTVGDEIPHQWYLIYPPPRIPHLTPLPPT